MTVTYELTGFILWSVAVFAGGLVTMYILDHRQTFFDHWK